VIGAWAMGAPPLTYPPEAGYPIGGKDFSSYVMIEIHYNNPDRVAGVVDSSGIKFHVTPTLREYDAGTMELGLEYSDKMALPPGQNRWPLVAYCIPECTQVGLGSQGIKVFASQLHTHQTGKQVYTKHYRAGVELAELNRDDHYSPHYQEIRKLPRHVHIIPGDALVTTCQDTTADKKQVTLGGFSISDEMCINYIHYYPRVDLEVCKSSISTSALYRFFKFLEEYQEERTSQSAGISDNFHAISWTPMNVRLLNTLYKTAPLSMQCNQSDGNRFPGNWEEKPIPKVLYPMPPTERPCLQ
jgi:dopamine beta-monooxygenase